MSARLREHYEKVVRPALMDEFKYENVMQVPRLEKIVINMGVGEAAQDAKKMEGAVADLTAIAGQKPIVTKAKTSIAQFKLRENQVVGCKVTLRNDRMYEFLDPSSISPCRVSAIFAVSRTRASMVVATMPWA